MKDKLHSSAYLLLPFQHKQFKINCQRHKIHLFSLQSSPLNFKVKVDVRPDTPEGYPSAAKGNGESLMDASLFPKEQGNKRIKMSKSHMYRISVHSEPPLCLLAHKGTYANSSLH